jgi:ABC-2 type transport system permease protein
MTIGALGMTMLYSGLSFGATAVIIEKERGRLDRMIAIGVKAKDLFFGKMISAGVILLAASVIVIIIGKILGAKIVWDIADFRYWLVPLNLFLVFIMTLSIGFMLSLISKSSRSAGTLGIVLGLLLSFTTGVWIPDFMLPEPMRVLAHSFPVTWALDLIRGIMVFDRDINMLISSQIKVVISTILLIALGIIAYRKVISRYVEIV